MNWYILYVLCGNEEKIVNLIDQEKELSAFIPRMEYYRRDQRRVVVKAMFPGYVFVLSKKEPMEFHRTLTKLRVRHQKMMKELTYEDATSLKPQEVMYFERLLDSSGVMRMSTGKIVDRKLKILDGPLQYFEDNIVKLDKHERMAYLDLEFMNRRVKASVSIIEG